MKEIIQKKIDFYNSITVGNKKWVYRDLECNGISILQGFIDNYNLVEQFYETYYCKSNKRIVLCGINPGRFGAGKTGVPFIDFKSLKQMLPKNKIFDNDIERSAQFMFSVIKHFGYQYFFDNAYLTNISWFGFLKGSKNYNYYNLNSNLQQEFLNDFIEEMEIVQPSVIIPLGEEVEKSLNKINKYKKYKIVERLPHPNYASFNNGYENELNNYIEVLENIIN